MKQFFIKYKWPVLIVAGLAILFVISFSRAPELDEEAVPRHRYGEGRKVMRTPAKHKKTTPYQKAYRPDADHRKADVKLLDEDTGEVDMGQYDDFHGHDRILAQVMDRAFWDDDMTNTLAAVIECVDSHNPELRQKAIEYAAWYGKDGMDALMYYMADPDEELAESARTAWVEGMRQIEDDEERAALVAPLAKIMTDPDMVEGMLMSLNDLPNIAMMQVLVDVIDTGTDAANQVALEHYEFVTGEEFTTVEAAQKWLDENWEEDDEAFVNHESVDDLRDREFAEETAADIDTAAQALGVTSKELEDYLCRQADSLGLDGESFVSELNSAARQSEKSTPDYIIQQLKDIPLR